MIRHLCLLFVLTFNIHTPMSAQQLDGTYHLSGIQDMAAGFTFTPDGRFDFFYIYGVSDRNATGTYTIEGDTIKLHSDKPPGADFKIESQSKKGKGYTIEVKAPDPFLLQNILCFYFIGDVQETTPSNQEGIIHIDAASIDKLFVRHEIFPDIPTLIKDKDNDHNHFVISMLPSLGQVSFKGIDLMLDGDILTCLPNYFMPFQDIRFYKD